MFTVLKVAFIFWDRISFRDGSFDLADLGGKFYAPCCIIVAITKDNLKARLAYSTISQLSTFVTLASSIGILGGGLQVATHAIGKIIVYGAGAIYVARTKPK